MTTGSTDREAMIVVKRIFDIDKGFKLQTVFYFDGSWYCTEDVGKDSVNLSCYKVGDKQLQRFNPFTSDTNTQAFLKAMNDDGYDKYGNKKPTQVEAERSVMALPSDKG